jgi:hypothetical protein
MKENVPRTKNKKKRSNGMGQVIFGVVFFVVFFWCVVSAYIYLLYRRSVGFLDCRGHIFSCCYRAWWGNLAGNLVIEIKASNKWGY